MLLTNINKSLVDCLKLGVSYLILIFISQLSSATILKHRLFMSLKYQEDLIIFRTYEHTKTKYFSIQFQNIKYYTTHVLRLV